MNEITIDAMRWLSTELAWERTLSGLRDRHDADPAETATSDEPALPQAA